MLHIVLVEPEIPANTGNIARTCAATGCVLHLIRPLGFDISDVRVYDDLADFFRKNEVGELWCLSTKAPRAYTEATFHDGCYLFFGKETKGLPEPFLEAHAARCLRIPMRAEARSLNLSNSVAITVFEALRQLDYPGLSAAGKMAAE